MVSINIKLLDGSLPLPEYAQKGDAGLDLYSRINCTIKPYERKLVPTGIKVAIPEGYAGFVQPKSGLAMKKGLSLVNTPGLIDSGYRGEISAILINLDSENDIQIKHGDKICQLVIQKIEYAEIKITSDLDVTSRGDGGFGSTG